MSASICVWGGTLNPIIPIFTRPPQIWRSRYGIKGVQGTEVAKGYMRFFEPDVLVEAEEGLLSEAGLEKFRTERGFHKAVVSLREFLAPERGESWGSPSFGLNMQDVLEHTYKTEQRFIHHETQKRLLVDRRDDGLTELLFGAYPVEDSVSYLEKTFKDVFKAERVAASPEAWREIIFNNAMTPRIATYSELDVRKYGSRDLHLYVFDADRPTDLLDAWNFQLESSRLIPIPLQWFESSLDDIVRILRAEHRPMRNNPQGLMHSATIEFACSISTREANRLTGLVKEKANGVMFAIKNWHRPIWIEQGNDYGPRLERVSASAAEKLVDLNIPDDDSRYGKFESLSPASAGQLGFSDYRWMNVVTLSNYGRHDFATLLPHNTTDRSWPNFGLALDQVFITSEGWAIPQRFAAHTQFVEMPTALKATTKWLEHRGIKAELSEPGHIARQMLEQLGGLGGTHLLADVDTLKLLNNMASSSRTRSNESETVEEIQELKTEKMATWIGHVAKLRKRRPLRASGLEAFTNQNVIRLGLLSQCPHCMKGNWSSLSEVDYRVTCDRCLKGFDFPQATLPGNNRAFAYRVIGPFSVPEFGRGSYSAILSLRVLSGFKHSVEMNFTTAMNLEFNKVRREVDFIAWHSEERFGHFGFRRPPKLIIGEAKSFGRGELVTRDEIAKLRQVADWLGEVVIVISVLRDGFTVKEKALLRALVRWGRRLNAVGEPRVPVILLTARELTFDYSLDETWRKLGERFEQLSKRLDTLVDLADATQQIHLDLPSFHEQRNERMRR